MKQSLHKVLSLVLYTLFVGHFICVCAVAEEVGHGEVCNEVDKICAASAFLECNTEKKCACKNPDTTFYDIEDKMCKVQADQKCSADAGAQPCIAKSSCAPRGGPNGELLCTCHPHLEGKRGQCFLPFGEYCDDSSLGICDEDSFQYCMAFDSRKYCYCKDDTNMEYSEKSKSCVLLVDAECKEGDQEQPCVEGAKCNSSKKCACDNGAENTRDRQCTAYYGDDCGTSTDKICSADDFLECNGFTCKCKGGDKAKYDTKSGKCQLLPGSECAVGGQPCNDLSRCPKGGGVCICEGDLQMNSKKECTLRYGLNCALAPPGWNCDSTAFLDCNKETGKCDCESLNETYYENGICKAREGKYCGSKECIIGSLCRAYFCECEEPLKASKNHFCVRGYGDPCGSQLNGDCDTEAFQACKNGECSCEDPINMEYDSTNQCFLKKGATCKEGEGNAPCAPGNYCGTNGKCRCNTEAGFEDNDKGGCSKPYGAPCKISEGPEGLCDMENFHMCEAGKCICNESHRQKEQGKGLPCVGQKNAQCNSDDNCDSSQDLVCRGNVCTSTATGIYLSGILSILTLFLALRKNILI